MNLMASMPKWTWDFISAMRSYIEIKVGNCLHKNDLRVSAQFQVRKYEKWLFLLITKLLCQKPCDWSLFVQYSILS